MTERERRPGQLVARIAQHIEVIRYNVGNVVEDLLIRLPLTSRWESRRMERKARDAVRRYLDTCLVRTNDGTQPK